MLTHVVAISKVHPTINMAVGRDVSEDKNPLHGIVHQRTGTVTVATIAWTANQIDHPIQTQLQHASLGAFFGQQDGVDCTVHE